MLRVAYEKPFYEGLGTLLPCFWIYWEVGKILEKKGSPNPSFQKWISTYSSDTFGTSCLEVIAIADALVLTEEQKEKVAEHFVIASKLEYMFWDMGYHSQQWPV